MTNLELFLVGVLGMGIGSAVGQRFAKSDLVGRIGWTAVGAMPFAAYRVGEPLSMAAMLVAIPLLLLRRHLLAGRASEAKR